MSARICVCTHPWDFHACTDDDHCTGLQWADGSPAHDPAEDEPLDFVNCTCPRFQEDVRLVPEAAPEVPALVDDILYTTPRNYSSPSGTLVYMKTETIPGTRAIGERLARAHNAFVALIMEDEDDPERMRFTRAEAETIFAVYRKHRCVKLEAGIGRYSVKHGGYWAKDALARALELGTTGKIAGGR